MMEGYRFVNTNRVRVFGSTISEDRSSGMFVDLNVGFSSEEGWVFFYVNAEGEAVICPLEQYDPFKIDKTQHVSHVNTNEWLRLVGQQAPPTAQDYDEQLEDGERRLEDFIGIMREMYPNNFEVDAQMTKWEEFCYER